MPTLADIFSTADSLKRRLSDTLRNPGASLDQMVNYANDRARTINEMTRLAAEEKDLYGPSTQALGQKLTEAYNPIGMTVYHGSPHVFERFDLGKIGAGTGQQVYGKGLYMAEAPEVAQQYQKNVKDIRSIKSYNEKLSQLSKIMEEDSAYPGAYRKFKSDKGQKAAQEYDALMEARNSLSTNPGNFYKVDLPDTHIRRMLDFDTPLKDQPYPVRNLAKKLGMDMNDLGGDLLEKIGKTEQGREVLQKAGIPGVKYYDQMKGGIDQWKRNFVVFDPNHLTILERNNQPIK